MWCFQGGCAKPNNHNTRKDKKHIVNKYIMHMNCIFNIYFIEWQPAPMGAQLGNYFQGQNCLHV
jgi:hypothetical protein